MKNKKKLESETCFQLQENRDKKKRKRLKPVQARGKNQGLPSLCSKAGLPEYKCIKQKYTNNLGRYRQRWKSVIR